jgi:hypothetical protein
MTLDRLFHWARIQGEGRAYQPLLAGLRETTFPAVERASGRPWGAWYGLFGLRSNELIVVTSWPLDAAPYGLIGASLPPGAKVLEQYSFVPTVRPETDAPLTRPGLYVFRFFDVYHRDADEVAALSHEAWITFEKAVGYEAEPQALFAERDRTRETGTMLLLTWYDGLESWQRSRTPAPEARENFRRRAELTLGTLAIATRIVET